MELPHAPFKIEKLDAIYADMELDMYFAFAAATLYIYDLLITIGLEVELLWPSKWCFLKVIYLVQRYLPLVDTIILGRYELFQDVKLCEIFVRASAYLSIIGLMFSELILTRRAIAIWGNQRKWWIGLYTVFVLSFIPSFLAIDIFLRGLTFTAIDLPHEHCFIGGGSPILFVCWAMLTLCDAGIFLAMAIPAFKYHRVNGSSSSTYKIVFRDGILYIFYQFALSMINVAVIMKWPGAHPSLLSGLERVIHSSLTSRVVLHIRAQLQEARGTDVHPATTSLIDDIEGHGFMTDRSVAFELPVLQAVPDNSENVGQQRPSTSRSTRSTPISVVELPMLRGSGS